MRFVPLIWSGIWRKPGRSILIFLQVSVAFALFGVLQGMKSGVEHLIGQARADGYAFNEGRIVSGMSAVGVPILNHRGRPAAALSCAAISSRMEADRRKEIVGLLHAEAAAITKRLGLRPSIEAGRKASLVSESS